MDRKWLICGLVAACTTSPAFAQAIGASSSTSTGNITAPSQPQSSSPVVSSPQSAEAQPASSDSASGGEIGEIVVTALRGNVAMQRAPAAITSVAGPALKAQGITDIRAFQVVVPEAHMGAENTATQVFIRGVGSSLDFYWIPETVAINIDGVYTPRYATSGSFLDIANVQVLPGPQGVLYGRSAGGGAIVISSNTPSNRFETIGDFETGTYGLVHASAVENVPISDTLSIRGGLELLRHGGYQNLGQFAQNSFAAKLALAYRPVDALTVTLRGSYYKDTGKSASTSYVPSPFKDKYYVAPIDPVTGLQLGQETRDYSYYTLSGDIKYDFGLGTVEYTAARLQQDGVENRAIVGNAALLDQHYFQYTQNLKISSDSGSRLGWIVGADWFDANARYRGLFGPNEFGNIFSRIDQKSYSVYAQLTYSVTDSLRLVGGGRYSVDKLKLDGTASACFFGNCFYPPVTFNQTYHNGDFKIGMEADLARQVLAYANIQSGYAPGSLNTFADSSGLDKQIRPQTLLAYTAGLKSRFDNQNITLNLEGYYYRFKDLIIQAFDDSTGQADLFNAPRATIYGLTLQTSFRLSDNDHLTGSVAYTHGRYGHFIASASDPDINGLQMQYTPDWTASASYEHIFPLPSGANLTARAATYFSSKYWGTFVHAPDTSQGAFTKSDFTLTYNSPSKAWSISAWVKNIENTAVRGSVSASGYAQPYGGVTYLEPPRTAGVRLQFKY